ncbi:MAG TPA: DUF11 domain-containing protein [Frankiaceae bacterium]|nr:DUF11 domain-containing protein [Frankiaceae bacterium]
MNTTLRRAGAATAAAMLAALISATPAAAQATSTEPGAAADAYALDVDVALPLNVKVDQGPFARSYQEYPPQQEESDTAEQLATGQIPAGGAVVENVGVLLSEAQAVGTPTFAGAAAQAAEVELISQGGVPLLTADVITAISQSDCEEDPSGEVEFVGLSVGGTAVPDQTPAPNTPLLPAVFDPLGITVMLNEQHPTADGRGMVVNAIHIYNSDPTIPAIFTGDVIVSHAMSTVNCPNGAGSTSPDDPDIYIEKNADKARAKVGETVTYTASITNNSDDACLVNQVTDHLPVAFEYVSTSGAFGTVATAVARPGGGSDVVIKPAAVTIAAGATATQTYVVTVKADAAPGTYFNNVEILCGNLGNWVKGLDAPVEVYEEDDPDPVPPDLAQCEDGKDNDGDGKVDYPGDPGCLSKKDDDERNELARTGPVEHASTLGVLLLLAAYGVRRRMREC